MLKLPIQFGQCLHICAVCVLGRMVILYLNFQRATFEFLHQDDLVLCCTTNVSILAKGESETFALMCFRTCSAQGTTSDYQSSIASSQSIEGYTGFNFSSSIKPADENSAQADLVKTSGAAEVTGKATMEEISARLSAKLALLEASQQVQHCKVQWLPFNFLMYTTWLICSFSRTNFSL